MVGPPKTRPTVNAQTAEAKQPSWTLSAAVELEEGQENPASALRSAVGVDGVLFVKKC